MSRRILPHAAALRMAVSQGMATRDITVTRTCSRCRSTRRGPAILLACTLAMASSVEEALSPARFRTGDLPPLPALAVGGGQVFLELAVGREGRVTGVTPLRTTPPFTDAVLTVVRDWEFSPARAAVSQPEARGAPPSQLPVASTVLVGGIFRPPALYGPTLGQAPEDVGAASVETPFPLTTSVPPYPPTAYAGGIVLLEVLVDRSGGVAGVRVVRSAPPFDGAAAETVKDWKFRPARVRGEPVAAFAYIMFGFPVPVGIRRHPVPTEALHGDRFTTTIRSHFDSVGPHPGRADRGSGSDGAFYRLNAITSWAV